MGLLDGFFNRGQAPYPNYNKPGYSNTPYSPPVQDFPDYTISPDEEKKKITERLKELERLQNLNNVPKPTPEQMETNNRVINKRIAAIEVIRALLKFKTWALASAIALIAAPVICLLDWTIGVIVGVLAAGVAGYFFFTVKKQILYLKNKYGV